METVFPLEILSRFVSVELNLRLTSFWTKKNSRTVPLGQFTQLIKHQEWQMYTNR